MKYCVLGAGLMGGAIVHDLLLQDDTKSVILVDNDKKKLEGAVNFLNDDRLETRLCDVEAYCNIPLQGVDVTISAIHYKFNLDVTKVCIRTHSHMCDLGGNSSIVDEQLKLDKKANEAGISIIPDCGLAPGMISILVKWGLEKFNWADTVKIRVGGLPRNPKNELRYERLFSIDGLINEYIEPVRVLRNGEIKIIEPLTEIEDIEFSNVGAQHAAPLQAFTTSGGASTLVDTYKGRLKNLDYKTIRYKGHLDKLRKIGKENFKEEFSKLPICKDDVTLVKIIFEGGGKKQELNIVDYARDGFTSMMKMTAFPIGIISQMQARGQIYEMGVQPQEKCVPVDLFIKELSKRNIFVSGLMVRQKA